MAVARMMALTVVGPKDETELVARHMVLRAGFQPIPLDYLVTDRGLRAKISTATENPYDALVSRLATVWHAAGEGLPEVVPVPLDRNFTLDSARIQVENAAHRLELWARRSRELEEELEELEAARVMLEALESMEFTLEDLATPRHVVAYFGRLAEDNARRLEETSEGAPFILAPLRHARGDTWALALAVAGYADGARALLRSANFKEYSFDRIKALLEKGKDALPRRVDTVKKSLQGLEKAAKNFLGERREELEGLFCRLYTMQRVYELCKGRGEIGDTYVFSGWVPADVLEELTRIMGEEAPRTTYFAEDSSTLRYGRSSVPTLLRNIPLVRAFQDVVALYSLPGYDEIDPSFVVAVSFCLMFGFMFGDVGHGLLLALGARYLVKRRILRKNLGTVLTAASVFSMIFGVLYGSVFGLEGLFPPLWFSPSENTDKLLSIALGAGVGFITLGLALNMVTQYRQRNFGRLLFDGQGLAGLAFYWSAALVAFWVFSGHTLPMPGWAVGGLFLALILVMAFRDVLARVVLHERAHGEGGVVHAFEVAHGLLAFLSNTASFVRLAAFALNHVGLSMAVFMLGDMVRDLPGGLVLKGLLLVVGNLIIVGLEGLIVFIQTLRLEYYEFFSKFYRGGGNAFRPVRWDKNADASAPPV